MATITIRDFPEEARAELAARAARAGLSMQGYLKARLLELVERPDVRTVVERMRKRTLVTGTLLPAEKILAYRDADRR